MKQISIFGLALIGFMACGKGQQTTLDRQKQLNHIDSLQGEMIVGQQLDTALGRKAIEAYQQFATHFKADSLAPEFLFRSAEVQTNLGDFKGAIQSYQRIQDDYKSYVRLPESIFMTGFLYDNFLKDTVKAKQLYQQVLDKYPESFVAPSAHGALQHMGKTDEELIRAFEKQANQGNKP